MKSRLIVLLLVFLGLGLSAQICTVETVEICAGQEVLLPVTGKFLESVGALTLYVGFDTNNLTILNVEDDNDQLNGMSVNLMSNPSQLAFAWSNTAPVTFINEKLFDLKFLANGSSAYVKYNSGCELSDTDGVVIPVSYIDGAINSGVPIISLQPEDTTVSEGGIAKFYTNSSNAGSFVWRESQDNGVSWLTLEDNDVYSGTNTNTLTISAVPFSYSQFLYQCVAYQGFCQINTDVAKLIVDKSAGITNELFLKKNAVFINPVIFSDFTNVCLSLYNSCSVKLHVFNSVGKIVMDLVYPSFTEGIHHINLNTSAWRSGIYFIGVEFITPDSGYNAVFKIIRN